MFQSRHALIISPTGPTLRTPPNPLGQRITNSRTGQHTDRDHAHHRYHREGDERHRLVDDVIQVQARQRRGTLDYVDPVRRSPAGSFPTPSRVLDSNRSVKSTRSASSATSCRNCSTAAMSSACPAPAPAASLRALSAAACALVSARTISHANNPPNITTGIRGASVSGFISSSAGRSAGLHGSWPAAARRSPCARSAHPPRCGAAGPRSTAPPATPPAPAARPPAARPPPSPGCDRRSLCRPEKWPVGTTPRRQRSARSRERLRYPYSARRRQPVGLPFLREQPLGEVEALLDLRQALPELVHVRCKALRLGHRRPTHGDPLLRGLERDPLLVGLRPPANPFGERFPDRPRQDQRSTDDQRQADHAHGGCPLSHATNPPCRELTELVGHRQ